MANKTQVFSVQPRFTMGETVGGWTFLEQVFKMGEGAPPEGSVARDEFMGQAWKNEPMTAGVFSKWVEKVQSTNWKVVGGKNSARFYADVFHNANNGRGWTDYMAGAIDFLSTDKGRMSELGRLNANDASLEVLRSAPVLAHEAMADAKFMKALEQTTEGRVAGIQHIDSARMIKIGMPKAMWRYYPERGFPVTFPDLNLIQITPMASARERLSGFGASAMSRVLDAKNLMVGYLRFFMQEIGELPPEMVLIINGLDGTRVEQSYMKYKEEAKAKGLDTYPGRWWLGSDDPSQPVKMETVSLLPSNKAFNYQSMTEWWVKTLALNTGEAVGDFWLMQHPGNTGTLESVQEMKAEGSGTGRYLQEKERAINHSILPEGTRFEFDNRDDEQDKARADIVSTRVNTLKSLAEIGGESPLFDEEKLKQLALEWNIVPREMVDDENIPTVITSTIKEAFSDDLWVVTNNHEEYPLRPLLKSSRDIESAQYVYTVMKEFYGVEL